tara:strand:- start:70 stop:252 length:183 start_codon:yes stop_codon:yes gene_type:complete
MNSFDKIQCEESPEYQWASMMEEIQFLKERIEQKHIEAQKELDELSDKCIDEIFGSAIDF